MEIYKECLRLYGEKVWEEFPKNKVVFFYNLIVILFLIKELKILDLGIKQRIILIN